MRYLLYDGVDSRSLNLIVFGLETDSAPAREYTEVRVPGRNGSLLLNNNSFPNVKHRYTGYIISDMRTNLNAVKGWLMSRVGYKRLEDDDHPDEFYMAAVLDAVIPELIPNRQMARAEIIFSRKPERYLKSGETVTTLTASGTITNPTAFASRPLLRIYGEGTVGIGDNSVTIASADDYTDVDCDTMEAYKGTQSLNTQISLLKNDFPVLNPGSNGITLGAGISKVEITPRWWRV